MVLKKNSVMPTIKPIKGHYFIKWLHAGLYSAAAQIECDSCERFWTQGIIKNLMRRDHRMGGYVISDLDNPVGYIVFEKKHSHREICVQNLVVKSDYRQKGLGSILMDRVVAKLKIKNTPCPTDKISIYTRESNLGAHFFLKKYGFTAIGVSKDHFEDIVYDGEIQKEDAYHFVLSKKT